MNKLHRLTAVTATAALAIGLVAGLPSRAGAQSPADFAEMAAALKRLEARVGALEGENRQAKQEASAARAEARALRHKLGIAAPGLMAAAPIASPSAPTLQPGIYAMATKAPPLAPTPSMGGLYWGASFGTGWLRGQAGEASNEVFNAATSPGFLGPAVTETDVTNSNASLAGRNAGAIGSLYLGYNFLATPTVVIGGQVEGGISNIRVNLAGTGSSTTNSSLLQTPPGLPFGLSTSVSSSTFNATDSLDNRWTVSLLGRGGVLVDPVDYVYLLGGYTYARFETFNSPVGIAGQSPLFGAVNGLTQFPNAVLRRTGGEGFGLNGATIGGGWERQIAPGWSLRGEYRYTKFQGKDVSENFVTNSSFVQVQQANGSVLARVTSSDNFTATSHIAADMYSLSIGVAHYFDR
jgi:outer membrane immunogenic protein